jgi:hypothetical protein
MNKQDRSDKVLSALLEYWLEDLADDEADSVALALEAVTEEFPGVTDAEISEALHRFKAACERFSKREMISWVYDTITRAGGEEAIDRVLERWERS